MHPRGKPREENLSISSEVLTSKTAQYETAIESYQKARQIAEERGDKAQEAFAYYRLAEAYRATGQYETAIESYQRTRQIAEEIGDKEREAAACSGLGVSCHSTCQYETAIESYQKARQIAEEIGDKQEEAFAYNGLGEASRLTGQYETAIESHQKARQIAEEIGDKQGEAFAYNGLGNSYRATGQYEMAIESCQKAREIAQKRGDKTQEAKACIGLGQAYKKSNQHKKAIENYQKARKIAEETGDKAQVSVACMELGNVMTTAHHELEIESHQKAGQIVEETGDKRKEAEAHPGLSPEFGNTGEHEQKAQTNVGKQGVKRFKKEIGGNEPPKKRIRTPTSEIHKEKIFKLRERLQKGKKVQEINGIRVCCKPEFQIGEGSRGTAVYIGLGRDGSEKAVKRIPKTGVQDLGETEKEIMTSSNAITSKHVLKYFWYDDTSSDDFAYLIVDLCEENLLEFVERQGAEELTTLAPRIIRQILQGLKDLHGPEPNQILHRDLKPSNILRDVHDMWLLADFGISRVLSESDVTYYSEQRGNMFWRAVESFPNIGGDVVSNDSKVRYKKKSDVQVAGMVCFYILTKGKHPFGNVPDRLRNLLDRKPVGLDQLADPAAKDLISWMLQHEPENRPSAEEALKHPYLQSPDLQFELLVCVGNEVEIKTKPPTSNVVQQLNGCTDSWKTQIRSDVLAYLCSDGSRPLKYGDEWTECLRLIRNVATHWNDRACRRPKVHYDVGEPKEYFLNTFPNLPSRVHQIIRSYPDWKERSGLKKFF